MASGGRGVDLQSYISDLQRNIEDLLRHSEDNKVLLNHIWTLYRQRYDFMPDQHDLGLTKKKQILTEHCGEICTFERVDRKEYVVLIQNEEQDDELDEEEYSDDDSDDDLIECDDPLRELMQQIHAFLVSKPEGVPKKKFWQHFHKTQKRQIPAKKFGVKDHVDLLEICSGVWYQRGPKIFACDLDSTTEQEPIVIPDSPLPQPVIVKPKDTKPVKPTASQTSIQGPKQPKTTDKKSKSQTEPKTLQPSQQAAKNKPEPPRVVSTPQPSPLPGFISFGNNMRRNYNSGPGQPSQQTGAYGHGHYQQNTYHHQQQQQQQQQYGRRDHSGPTPAKKLYVPKEQLDNVARDCIERLAETKTYVSAERIEALVMQHYHVDRIDQLMNLRSVDHITAVHEHLRVQCKVNAYTQAFMKTRAISTLHELTEALRAYVADDKEFESLNLGPITQQPLVYEYFKFPPEGVDVPEISTEDVLEYVRSYLTEKNLWTSRQNDLADFMQYVNDQRGSESPFELGIRIRSLPLAVGVLKRAQKDTGGSIRGAITRLKSGVENDLATAFSTFTHTVVLKEPGICEVKQDYLSKTPKQLMDILFQKVNVLYSSVSYLQGQSEAGKGQIRELHRTQDVIHNFLSRLRQDKMLQQLFQLAVCCSQSDIHLQFQEILAPSLQKAQAPGAGEGGSDGGSGADYASSKPKPQLDELVALVKKYIERCLSQGLNLTHLARIENKILEDLDAPHYHALGHGSFLDTVAHNGTIKQFLEDSGAASFGLSSSGGAAAGKTPYHASHDDLATFVHQCQVTEQAQAHLIEAAVCHHYGCPDVKSLGHGSAAHYLQLQGRARPPYRAAQSAVYYEGALAAKSRSPLFAQSRKAGVLGHQTRDAARICLHNCPLLEDLHEWSHWDVVYQPELGDLKDFVLKYGGTQTFTVTDRGRKAQLTTSTLALETRPGCLLKLTANTSPERLAAAALRGDARATTGHLASLIVGHKGVENTGLVLLGNHVKTALIRIQANVVPGAPGPAQGGAASVASFVLECLTLLPSVLCLSVAQKVFLEPLSAVVGQAKSRELLLAVAVTTEARGRLQLLGMLLGLDDWGRATSERAALQKDDLTYLDAELADIVMVDEESSDESDAESNIDVVLSDSEDETMDDATEDSKQDQQADIVKVESQTEGDPEATNEDAKKTPTETSAESEDCIMVEDSSDESKHVASTDDESKTSDLAAVPEGADSSPFTPAQMVVEQIRREEFGVDVVLSDDGQKLMRKQQERLGRSLDRLSRDLYSKDTHFVLELIQNADDNSYPDSFFRPESSTRPSVKFIVDKEAITVLNNECGFQEKDIRALCDVGKSTKGQHKFGYIGQKGIGFKSVFRVTDRPEIHSNSYHMCFDVNSGPTGYILPHWIDEADQGEGERKDRWRTRIVLPLKAAVDMTSTQSLAARFQDVHPSLLLFLHRLKNMTVVNKVENYTLKVRRQDIGDNIIEIKHSKGTDRWFVVKKTLDASKISLQAKSGVDVLSTEIAMAFPLQSQDSLRAQVVPEKQPVFAFLPLRSYGFRFVIQGDFDVPSSREDVDRDSLWNQWLCSEIHQLFVDALQTFKSHESFDPVAAVCQFLQFVPLEGEILDFFGPVAAQILQLLRAQPCLPTAGDNGALQWRLPSQLVTTSDPLVREVIPAATLRHTLSLDYLHPDVATALNPGLRASLGVQTLALTHLLEVHRAKLAARLLGPATPADISDVARWLTCVYRALDDLHQNDEVIATLRALPTIPLVNGDMVALDDQNVFFPIDKEQRRKKGRDLLLALESDLNTVHPGLLRGPDSVASSQVCRLLETLGVRRLTPHDITHHHIMGVLQSDQWKTKPRDLLLSYVVYIKQQLELDPGLLTLDDLRNAAVLLTNHGPVRPRDVTVHFTTAYSNNIDLQKMLPGYDWTMLDGSYLSGASTDQHIQHWREFFAKLGVLDFVAVKDKDVTMTKDQMKSSVWRDHVDLLPASDTYKLKDVTCPEFSALVESNKAKDKLDEQCMLLFKILDRTWDSMYSKGSTVTRLYNSEGQHLMDVETSFALNLKRLHWVPAVVSTSSDDALYSIELKCMIPRELFIPKPEIEKLLAHHVSYLEPKVQERSTFAQFLGVNFRVSIDFVKDKLISWCDREDDERDTPRNFTTSPIHIKNVYKYLHENLTPKDLQDLLHQYPVILVFQKKADVEIPTAGQFLTRQEVRWSDPSGLFLKHESSFAALDTQGIVSKPIINGFYRDMEEFFLKSVRVQKSPSLEEYAQLLIYIVNTSPSCKNPTDIHQILTIIGKELLLKTDDSNSLLELQIRNIKELLGGSVRCLPSKKAQGWVGVVDKPMISDDRVLERLLKDKQEVVLLDCGEKTGAADRRQRGHGQDSLIVPEAITLVYETLGVPRLSACVDVTHITELYRPCPQLQLYVRDVITHIQRILAYHYLDLYDDLKNKGVAENLAAMSFGQVGKLELVYSLRDHTDPPVTVVQTEKCQIIDHTQFCVHQDYAASYNDINNELARYFSLGDANCQRHIKSMLMDAMECPQRQDQHFLETHELYSLPPSETEWTVPEPAYYQPPPRTPSPYMEQPVVQVEVEPPRFGPVVMNNDPDKGSGLKSWPPKSHVDGPMPGQANARPTGSTVWPPPKPSDHMDRSSLPENLRPSKYASHGPTDSAGPPRATSPGAASTVSERTDHGGPPRSPRQQDVGGQKHDTVMDTSQRGGEPSTSGGGSGFRGPGGNASAGAMSRHSADGVAMDTGVVTEITDTSMVIDYPSDGTQAANRDCQRAKKRFRVESNSSEGNQPYTRKPVFFNGPREWTEDPSGDQMYEALSVSPAVMALPARLSLDGGGAKAADVGLWGERLVHDYLLNLQQEPDAGIVEVLWMNEDEESGKPYDFVLTVQTDAEGSEELIYIEVKTTASSDKEFFEISSQEFNFAQEIKENFHLYRVFNAGSDGAVRLTRLENLALKMDTKQVRLCMVV